MKRHLPNRRMRAHPDLNQLKRQAKELLRAFHAVDSAAVAEVRSLYDNAQPESFALHDAQLVIARSYGFESWPKLKAFVDGVTIRRLVDAVCSGDRELARRMLTARPELADMSLSYGDERRAIHFAVMERRPDIVRLLMQRGANARAGVHPHRAATSAWTMARERGFNDITAIIEDEEERRAKPASDVEGARPPGEPGESAEREAVARGNLAWLRARMAEGQFTNVIDWREGGLLTAAVENDQLEVLRFLLESGFDPDERISSGQGDWSADSQGYPLWHAAALGREKAAKLLLDAGADPNVHVDSSGSSVYSAYSHKQWAMVDLLCARGGKVSADVAAIYRRTDIARQLLADDDAGVLSPASRSSDAPLAEELLRHAAGAGATAILEMSLARINWSRDDPRWFRMLGEPLSFWHHIPWLYAGVKEFDREGYFECFRRILERCDANVGGAFGRTILHEIAAMRDWITEDEVATFGRAALNAGARLDGRDELLNSTPLGWACRWGHIKLVRLLLEHGADREERDAPEWTRPRAWARKMGHSGVLEVLG